MKTIFPEININVVLLLFTFVPHGSYLDLQVGKDEHVFILS